MKAIVDKKNKYVAMFNPENGFYVRMGENDIDPFQGGHPELADICITTVCNNNCPYCYQNSQSDGYHMPFEDYKFLMDQFKSKTLQIAIGGGEPTLHPNFVEILKATREAGIVPNYTTNGMAIRDYIKHGIIKDDVNYHGGPLHRIGAVIGATKKYCGAVAVSYHENMDVVKTATKELIKKEITTNVHYVVNEENIEEAGEFLTEDFEGLHAIIYLLYKPIGRATSDKVITSIPRLQKFINRVTELSEQTGIKIGFDACFCNYLVRYTDFDPTYFDSCDSGRFSIYVSEKLDVSPCSFNKNIFGNLRDQTLAEIWNGRKMEEYREGIRKNKCKGKCDIFELCYGGCPILDVNLCKEDYKEEK